MAETPPGSIESAPSESPWHGYRGESEGDGVRPAGICVAISREAGAGGGTIAQKLGRLLGWQVIDQELLEFLSQDPTGQFDSVSEIPAGAKQWAMARYQTLICQPPLSQHPELHELIRWILLLASRGETIFVGRGAGYFLPAESTVFVRIVATVNQRVAYLQQRFRLTEAEALAELERRDRRRGELRQLLTGQLQENCYDYDLILNTSRLSIETCAQIIAQVARAKQWIID